MNRFDYTEGSMRSLIDQMLEINGGIYDKQVYRLTSPILQASVKYFQLEEGIEFSVNSYHCKEDTTIFFHGDKNTLRYICFRFSYNGDVTQGKISELPNEKLTGGMIAYDTSVSTEIHLKSGQHYQWVGVRVRKEVFENDEHRFKEFFGDIFSKEKGKEWLLYDNIPLEIHILLKDIFSMNTSKPPIVQNIFITAKSCEMISIFFDRILSRQQKRDSNLHSQDFEQLMKVKNHLLSSLENVPSLDELAEIYGFSTSKLRRDFHQVFGTPIIKFHLNYRLEKAKIMLATEANNIQNISRLCGFKSNSKFSFYFKKKYNITPKEVAKKYASKV